VEKVETGQTHKKNKKEKYLFNPYEIAICGLGSFEKNIFFLNLAEQFNKNFDTGKVDYPNVSSNNSDLNFFEKDNDFVLARTRFLNYDFVLINSQVNPDVPKIVFINPGETIETINEVNYGNVIAYTGTTSKFENQASDLPYFQFNEINKIKEFILEYFNNIAKKYPYTALY
jgi:hypothetical protein